MRLEWLTNGPQTGCDSFPSPRRAASQGYEPCLPVAPVVQPGAVGCPVTMCRRVEALHRTCCGEAMYWQGEAYALGSPFHIAASQR